MDTESERLKHVWNQQRVAVALRRTGEGEKTRVRMPGVARYSNHDRMWIVNSRVTTALGIPVSDVGKFSRLGSATL